MLNTNPALIQLLDYFVEYYVGRWVQHPNGIHMVFQAPRFPMDMWNMYKAALAEQARTNNAKAGTVISRKCYIAPYFLDINNAA